MEWNSQRVVLAAGGALAVVAGVVVAVVFMNRGPAPSGPPPASQSGLQVSVNATPSLVPNKKLKCFVDGVPVGEFSLVECAQKNGVDPQNLDVGLDDAGNLAAAPTASMAPPPALPPAAPPPIASSTPAPVDSLPPQQQPRPIPQAQAQPTPQPVQARGPVSACLRFSGSEWRQISDGLSLGGCVQALFAGRCVHPGEADYGRYGDVTLRLVPGRVEQSSDNRNFRPLVEQRRGCEIPSLR
jgi:hypothetical protein